MDETTLKTRAGLILEGCVAAALQMTTFSTFHATPKYDKKSMTPDFLIPNATSPEYFIEVTQTEARNSFQMKTLRYFESVCDAKAHFGSDVISVNVLMGDPDSELPASNIQAMYGFFDANLNPRGDAKSSQARARLTKLEHVALRFAGDESVSTREAITSVTKQHADAIKDLSALLQTTISSAQAKSSLKSLWAHERKRLRRLEGIDGKLPDSPSYKRPILNSLFFADTHFETLLSSRNPYRLPQEIKDQLIVCGLADATNTSGRLVINRDVLRFIANVGDARNFRAICSSVIETDTSMRFFFRDIQSADRRAKMSEVLWPILKTGGHALADAILGSLDDPDWRGIHHPQRC